QTLRRAGPAARGQGAGRARGQLRLVEELEVQVVTVAAGEVLGHETPKRDRLVDARLVGEGEGRVVLVIVDGVGETVGRGPFVEAVQDRPQVVVDGDGHVVPAALDVGHVEVEVDG